MAKFDFFQKQKKYIWENSYKKLHAKNLRRNSKIERVSMSYARAQSPKIGNFWGTIYIWTPIKQPDLKNFKNKKRTFEKTPIKDSMQKIWVVTWKLAE